MLSPTPPKLVTGYAHPLYAESMAEFGHPMRLPLSDGHILRRRIPGCELEDAIGCYPLFACSSWEGLLNDVEALEGELVSISLVADPFGSHDVSYLRRCFPDVVLPFKEHVVIDLEASPFDKVSAHHRRDARASLRKVRVELSRQPEAMLTTWWDLYRRFSADRGIVGMRAFSNHAFALQLRTPGIVMFVALADTRVVGAHLWYAHDEVCHSHLTVCCPDGRRMNAGYALHWTAMEHFRGRVKWLNLGGIPGTRPGVDQGLARFKAGWSTTTRTAYFCGRVLDRASHARLIGQQVGSADYFPGYRRGEFD